MKIYLLRHAQTRDNEHHIYGSRTDTPLSKTGKDSAINLVSVLERNKYDLIIISTLQRTLQTVQPYLDTLTNPIVITDERTIEHDLGDLTNTIDGDGKIEESQKQQDNDKISWTPPNGESIRDVSVRAKEFLNSLCTEYSKKTILVVGHQHFLRCFELLLLNRPIDDFYDLDPPMFENGELRSCDYDC